MTIDTYIQTSSKNNQTSKQQTTNNKVQHTAQESGTAQGSWGKLPNTQGKN